MNKKLSLKTELLLTYSAIMAIALVVFAVLFYYFIDELLNRNINESIVRASNTVEQIIEKNSDFKNSVAQSTDTVRDFVCKHERHADECSDTKQVMLQKTQMAHHTYTKKIGQEINNQISMDARNFFIQVVDKNNRVIWKSFNLINGDLPLLSSKPAANSYGNDYYLNPESNYITNASITGKVGDTCIADIKYNDQDLRVMLVRTEFGVTTIGYSLSTRESILSGIQRYSYIGIPIVLLLSFGGGFFLVRLFFRPLNRLVNDANEITAQNLCNRLHGSEKNDEIGRLTLTLNDMIERLEKSFIQIKHFTSDASHELKTPLTILRGELELALNGVKSPEEYEDVLVSALEEVVRLNNVVQTLLELSRADAGHVKLNFEESSITELMEDLVQDIEILAEEKGIRVESEIEKGVDIEFDSERMHQALLNIMDNAVKYTPEGGKVHLGLRKNEHYVYIEVRDSGHGIPEDQIERIFERFFRVDKARESRIQGNGLGLSIVKWIVDAHEGVINVTSKVNFGTTFQIKLPVSRN